AGRRLTFSRVPRGFVMATAGAGPSASFVDGGLTPHCMALSTESRLEAQPTTTPTRSPSDMLGPALVLLAAALGTFEMCRQRNYKAAVWAAVCVCWCLLCLLFLLERF